MPEVRTEVALLLRAETVAHFERAFGVNWRSRVAQLVDDLAPPAKAAEPPRPRKRAVLRTKGS
jgi:hypothetical protein